MLPAGLDGLRGLVDRRLRGLPLEPGAGLHEVTGEQAEDRAITVATRK